MSRVPVTEISPGDDVDETVPNGTILLWNASTQTIDGDNIRSGGIHQRNIAANEITADMESADVFEDDGPDALTKAAWGAIPMGAGDVRVGPFDIDTSVEDVIVVVSFEYEVELSDTGAGDPQFIWEFRLAYSTDNVTYTSLGLGTVRQVSMGIRDIIMQGSTGIAHYVTTSIDSATTYFRLEGQETNTAQVTMSNTTMYITRRKL